MTTLATALVGAATLSAATPPTLGTINTYNATSGALAITLPPLASLNVGASMVVEKNYADATTNAVTFNCNSGDTFADLTTSLVLTVTGENRSLQVISISGTKYWKVLTGKNLSSPTISSPTISSPTITGTPVFSSGIPAANLPNGITNFNAATQSQVTVAGTNYYVTNSGLALPATLKQGLVVGTTFLWNVAMTKTAAGTGAFNILIYRGTNGTTADTADVTQSIGTQTAAVDNMMLTVQVTITVIGATGSYYWSIIPDNKAVTATGFGVAAGTGAYFSGTVSSVNLTTASLIFGLGFASVTGTPTVAVPMVQSQAYRVD